MTINVEIINDWAKYMNWYITIWYVIVSLILSFNYYWLDSAKDYYEALKCINTEEKTFVDV